MKPGTLQMRNGKWRLCTARKGFPVRWESFDSAWVVNEILIGSKGLSPAIRNLAWNIAGKITFKALKKARSLAQKALEGPASLTMTDRSYLHDWEHWCSNLEMVSQVRFA